MWVKCVCLCMRVHTCVRVPCKPFYSVSFSTARCPRHEYIHLHNTDSVPFSSTSWWAGGWKVQELMTPKSGDLKPHLLFLGFLWIRGAGLSRQVWLMGPVAGLELGAPRWSHSHSGRWRTGWS